jgi:hypothetical protein
MLGLSVRVFTTDEGQNRLSFHDFSTCDLLFSVVSKVVRSLCSFYWIIVRVVAYSREGNLDEVRTLVARSVAVADDTGLQSKNSLGSYCNR